VDLVPELTEPVETRLGDLRRFDPLLEAWVDRGQLSDAEADLVLLATEATRRLAPLRITLPGASSTLAGAIALHGAIRTVTEPGRYPPGPTVLLTGAAERAAALTLDADGVPIAENLGAVRLRSDGRVQTAGSSRIADLRGDHRLLLVSPRALWPDLPATVGVAVVDHRALGSSYDAALRWALRCARLVHVIAELDPSSSPSGFEVDWPLIAANPRPWDRAQAWPILADLQLETAAADPEGLIPARQRIAEAARGNRPWPAPLTGAASLSRAIAGVAVPLSLYDAHTVSTIAVPFAERVDQLAETRPGNLPAEWSAFAETDWAALKRGLLDAVADVEERNDKAELIGTTVERLLADRHEVDIWVDSAVHGRALQAHLLSAGFAITPEQFENGRVAVRTFAEAHNRAHSARASVLTGLPSGWHLSAVVAAGVGGPLIVVTYPFEADRAPRYLGWMLNAGRRERHDERAAVLRRVLGPGLAPDPVPQPIHLQGTRRDAGGGITAHAPEYSDDAAEFAALADDEWLALAMRVRDQPDTDPDAARPAVAYLVDPGPAVLLLGQHAIVDRLVSGRLRPVPAADLETGMQVLGTSAGAGVFASVRPHLDRVHGLGTKFWLDQWDEALRGALTATGGAVALARRLASGGATISAQAVASWVSPYRIGPRDPGNVRRVALIGGHLVVAHHHSRVHAVMRGVRVEHGRIGRQLATALRRHLDGDADAFDMLEERLGIDIDTMLGDPAVYTVLDRLASGSAPSGALGRAHPVAAAQALFRPQEDR
jgi:hypothetical protein